MATDIEALLADLEALKRDCDRLFSLDVEAVVRTTRKYWPSRYKEPKRKVVAPGPGDDTRKGFRFECGTGLSVHPKGPATALEMKSAPVFYDMAGRPVVNSVGESLVVVPGWEDRCRLLVFGDRADRCMETIARANKVVSSHAGTLVGILFPGERVSVNERSWAGIVDRVSELAGSNYLCPPKWQVSNGRMNWSVEIWKQRDEFSLGDSFYRPEDVELIGDDPEWVFSDRTAFVGDSELALEWLIEQVKGRVDAAVDPEPQAEKIVGYTDKEMEDRDRFIYQQRRSGKSNPQVVEALAEKSPANGWEPLTADQSIRDAVNRYIRLTGADPLPRNKGGRPRAKTPKS